MVLQPYTTLAVFLTLCPRLDSGASVSPGGSPRITDTAQQPSQGSSQMTRGSAPSLQVAIRLTLLSSTKIVCNSISGYLLVLLPKMAGRYVSIFMGVSFKSVQATQSRKTWCHF